MIPSSDTGSIEHTNPSSPIHTPLPRPVPLIDRVATLSSNNKGSPGVMECTSVVGDALIDVDSTSSLLLDPDFCYSDGNIELQISNHRFWVHEFLLTKFTKLSELIHQARGRGEYTTDPECRTIIHIPNDARVEPKDFRSTFRVIYSSMDSLFSQAPPSSDTETLVSRLVSTLRVATLFENLGLRNFAIAQLESKQSFTTAINRIALSDELILPNWEFLAFTELCRRPEPISVEEANILGVSRFVEIARIREAEKHRRYIELIDGVTMNPFLNNDGTIKKDIIQTTAKKTLEHTSLPKCDCRVRNQCSCHTDAYGSSYPNLGGNRRSQQSQPQSQSSPVITCQIHQLAPSIHSESQALYEYFTTGLEKIGNLKTASAQIHDPSGSDTGRKYSIENELRRAAWVRKAE